MFRTVTFLTVTSQLQFAIGNLRTCVPNTQFFLNGLICSCDSGGQWTDASCLHVSRRQNCQAGNVIWQGCSQCICQENGQFLCNFVNCPDDSTIVSTTTREGLSSLGAWCTPFMIYYVECSICVCPASGRVADAHCAKDTSCTAYSMPPTSNILVSANKHHCLPKVMYLFSCLQCLCSDEGYFVLDNCLETCQSKQKIVEPWKCMPKTFYRKHCNVCFCPDNGIPNDKYCTQKICNGTNSYKVLNALRTEPNRCIPYQFTPPRCLYCDCSPQGTVNEQACLELYCLRLNTSEFKITKKSCNPGEMVPICTQCFCLRNGSTLSEYCTKGCSYRNKLAIIEKLFKANHNRDRLIDIQVLERNTITQSCMPNSVYFDNGNYCLCPDDGISDQKSCIIANKKGFNFTNPESEFIFNENKFSINFNATCEPSTFVEFDCNTCFCSKNATIDPKWCTYDDCEAIKIVKNAQQPKLHTKAESSTKCTPGTITNLDCNFCICPENGQVKNRACTNNHCSGKQKVVVADQFDCNPLAYYEVDCNICFCPRDGKKNVDKCTKNLCESNFLRSDLCVPGALFSYECNVCVCPPSGDKVDKACTQHNCHQSATSWKSIYKLSNSILGSQVSEATTRKLDLCFPGEEFRVDCHLCVCPDMGIRSYAACTNMFCNETKNDMMNRDEIKTGTYKTNKALKVDKSHIKRRGWEDAVREGCFIYNVSDSAERKDCSPGSMYIIRCKQCICPYMGNINNYCRPIVSGEYCEQAYPNINYLPMGRRDTAYSEEGQSEPEKTRPVIPNRPSHSHTHYQCDQPGKVMDRCFICECEEDRKIIKEHCFINDAPECQGEEPSFLKDIKMMFWRFFLIRNFERLGMFHKVFLLIVILGNVSSDKRNEDVSLNLKACSIGDVIENECSKCTCSLRHVYECTPKKCPKISNVGDKIQALKTSSCHPYRTYQQLSTICICKPDGRWPHASCLSTFRSLPANKIVSQTCSPESYVIIECNICWCNKKGEIDVERCTKNECDRITVEHRRKSESSNIFGKCETKNWYSLAPCQFCFCLKNNKLLCNAGTYSPPALRLGLYNFTQCGTGLLKEILELVPDGKLAVNALRIGSDTHTVTETTTAKSWPYKIDLEDGMELALDVNSENKAKKVKKNEDNQKQNLEVNEEPEIEKDSAEKVVSEDRKFTRQPEVEDDSGTSADDKDDRNNDDEESAEPMPSKSADDKNEPSESWNFNSVLPQVLSKMLSLRKSVVLETKTKCEPGMMMVVKCNVCHCLKNGKLICTNKKCD